MDGSDPVYFIIGAIALALILYYGAKDEKKEIDQGHGDDFTDPPAWGYQGPTTHKEDYEAYKIALWIFVISAVIYFLFNF